MLRRVVAASQRGFTLVLSGKRYRSLLSREYGGGRGGPAWKRVGFQLFAGGAAGAVGKVEADAMRFRINHPDFFSAMREILLHFPVQLGGGVGFGRHFDGDGRSTVVVAVRIGAFD